MKRLEKILKPKTATHIAGLLIAVVAVYFSVRNVNGEEFKRALLAMDVSWIMPIVIGNFAVIALKALRWQIVIKSLKNIKFLTIFKVLTIGFMANNVLPARLGEVVRIHILGRDASISRISTTASVIADRVVESLSFLLLAALLILFFNVPGWMYTGLIIVLLITLFLYTVFIIYSKSEIKNTHLLKFQDGIRALCSYKIMSSSLVVSLLSWFMQGLMLYMTQLAFGVEVPVWGILVVILSINLAIALPSAPSHIGTFEFACVVAYTFLGVDKSLGLLIGIIFHLLQIIPVTLAGGLLLLQHQFASRKTACREDLDRICTPQTSQQSRQ